MSTNNNNLQNESLLEQRLRETFKTVKQDSRPKAENAKHIARAFGIGGGICLLGQYVKEMCIGFGFEKADAGTISTLFLILLTAILTSIGIFDKIGHFAGAGTFVPITGFANSIVSSAIEFKSEGHVFGIGAQIFKVAGPVILYGITSAWAVGLVYFLIGLVK
ncbi:MAG: SpoVA/SpoVAEb family sporulation membrane protein [Eubacteriaceae bacterium]|nr:SpoVA/SpoVAEb family sporulation membrane protein [Eubacteriaceae bacterium]